MDWDAIGAMGEVVAAIAVVVSIGYLAIQIRANTSAMKASASFDATHSWAEHNSAVLGPLSDELWLSAVRANDPGEPAENFTDLEKLKFAVLNRALFQKLEGQYFLYKHGYLEPGLWQARRRWAQSHLKLPLNREWWNLELGQSIFSEEFIDALLNPKAQPFNVILAGIAPTNTQLG